MKTGAATLISPIRKIQDPRLLDLLGLLRPADLPSGDLFICLGFGL